jgi:hypothetical protein
VLKALPISSSLTWSPLYLVKQTSCEAPHYAVFFSPLPLRPKFCSQHPVLKHFLSLLFP